MNATWNTKAQMSRSDGQRLTVRRFALEGQVPRHWFDNNVLLTHACNAQNMLFPALERFFVRTVRRNQHHTTDPVLRQEIRSFIGQEAQHGHSHDKALDILREQGFRIDGWLGRFDGMLRAMERWAPSTLCLSVVAAVEHFTASVAECWLTEGKMDLAHPEMATMLGWHAAEEIEHKSVVFDLLMQVDARWSVRALGMLIAAVGLLLLLISATVMLLVQDPEATMARVMRERRAASKQDIRATRFLERHMVPYLRPGFHPDDNDNYHIAAAYLASIDGRLRTSPARRKKAV
ncbi:MAG: metal-dependent hydrolase [Myxococcota bacterium]